MQIASTELLRGKTVLEAGGQVVGTLDEILIDTDSWTVATIRLRLKREIGKEIGAAGGMFQGAFLEIPIDMVAGARDAVILSVPLARLREVAEARGARANGKELPPANEPV
jgi:sporulation protein YlmC with PRC-barrel domain